MAVSRAVRAGRLVASVVRLPNGKPAIADPDLADREWVANTDHTKAPAYVKEREAARARALASSPPPPAPPTPPAVEVDPAPAELEPEPSPASQVGEPLDELSVATASARLKKWQADLAELKFREAARELLPARDVERRLVDVFSACKVRLLALPSRAKQALPHLSVSDLEELERIVREALEDLTETRAEPAE